MLLASLLLQRTRIYLNLPQRILLLLVSLVLQELVVAKCHAFSKSQSFLRMIFVIKDHYFPGLLRIQHPTHFLPRFSAFLKAFMIVLLILDQINIDPVFESVIRDDVFFKLFMLLADEPEFGCGEYPVGQGFQGAHYKYQMFDFL